MKSKININNTLEIDHIWKLIKTRQFEKSLEQLEKVSLRNIHWLHAKGAALHGMELHDEAITYLLQIKRPTKAILNCLAHCYVKKQNHKMAIQTYKAIIGWEMDNTILFSIARCYQDSHQNIQAIEIFKKIENWQNNKNVLIGIARVYGDQKHYDKAIEYYHKVSGWQSDYTTLLSLARCYQEMGNYSAALQTYNSIDNFYRDKVFFILLARCYQQINDYEEAINTYKKIPSYLTDKEALISLAHCYRENGQHDQAFKIYNSIPLRLRDNDYYHNLAMCYQEIGDFEKTMEIYKLNVNWFSDKRTLYGLARCSQLTHNFEAAVCYYQQIPNWENDNEALTSLAICYHEVGLHDMSLATFLKIKNIHEDPNALLSLGRYYQTVNQHNKAVETYQISLKLMTNKETQLSLARCYQQMGQHQLAIETYQSIYNWKIDKQVLICLSRCHEEMSDFKTAIELLHSVPFWKNNKELRITLARCFEQMGNFAKALEIYHQTYCWQEDKTVILSLARCYQNKGDFNEAIRMFKFIPSWEDNHDLVLGLAWCYYEMGQYHLTIEIILSIKGLISKEQLLCLARAYQAIGNYDNAIETYHKINFLDNDATALIALGRCYEEMSESDKAIDVFKAVPNFKNNKKALLALACCYSKIGRTEEAYFLYNQILTQFPYYQTAYYHFCNFLVTNNDPSAEEKLNDSIEKWPYMSKLAILKSYLYYKNKNQQESLQTLCEASEKFPYATKIHLAIIRHYLFSKQVDRAKIYIEHCLTIFNSYDSFKQQIDDLMSRSILINIWNENFSINEKMIHINLPSEIQQIFSLVEGTTRECYLVGSTIHALISNNYSSQADIDLLLVDQDGSFKSDIFIKSPYHQQLYHARFNNYKIDGYLIYAQNKSLIKENMLSRDFTISCLYCTHKGDIYDPSGMGIEDLKNGILRTLQPAEICFQEDPIRLLRAIDWMTRGFTPDIEVVTALATWKNLGNINEQHLLAIVRKHLLRLSPENKVLYVSNLQKYELMEKLFYISPNSNVDFVLTKLQLKAGLIDQIKHDDIAEQYRLPSTPSLYPRYADIFEKIRSKKRQIEALDLAFKNEGIEDEKAKNFLK